MTIKHRCPACNKVRLVKHCNARLCDLYKCESCGGMGWANGKRWSRPYSTPAKPEEHKP